ncbi:MAG TPA: phasin family protein [Bryobacteraceae bacterium]|nr:phasin family protein [Bryobacteraceae bacterium]
MATNPTTTVNQMTDQMADTAHAGRTLAAPVVGAAQGVWWVTLGLVTVAGEQTARLIRALARKGREAQPVVTHGVSSAVGGVESGVKNFATKVTRAGTGATGGKIEERIESTIQRLGVVTRSEIQALENRIEELKRELGTHEREAHGAAPPEGEAQAKGAGPERGEKRKQQG